MLPSIPPSCRIRGSAAGPNLQADPFAWSLEQFVDEINTDAGSPEPDKVMPWKDIARLDAIELEALHLWLHRIASK